jgi:hypothetical protein
MTHASGNGAGRDSQSAQTDPGTAGDRGVFARVLIDASIVHIWLRRIESVACDASQTPAAEKRGELAIGPIRSSRAFAVRFRPLSGYESRLVLAVQ